MSLSESITEPVLPWDDQDYVTNPYPWYEKARRDFPIYRSDDGAYVLTRYEDVTRYAKLPSLSIVDPVWVPKGPWAALSKTVLALDPPQHTAMRRRSWSSVGPGSPGCD